MASRNLVVVGFLPGHKALFIFQFAVSVPIIVSLSMARPVDAICSFRYPTKKDYPSASGSSSFDNRDVPECMP